MAKKTAKAKSKKQKAADARKQSAAARAKAGKEPKQQNLPTVTGAEKKIQRAALYYREKRDVRMGCTEDEVAAQAALDAAMLESGHKPGDVYTFKEDGRTVSCTLTEGKVKTKVKTEDNE